MVRGVVVLQVVLRTIKGLAVGRLNPNSEQGASKKGDLKTRLQRRG